MIWYHNLVSVSETMNKKSKLKHRRKRRIPIRELNIDFDDIWEPIYLVLLATFVGMRFLLSTMFTIYWPEYFYRTLLVIGITLVMLHLMTVKDMQKKEIAAMAIVTFIFLMSHYVSGYDFLVDLLILILGAYRVDFEKILKTYMAVWVVLMAITIVGALTGAAENLVYHQGENGERTRMALGICYPTDFAAYVAYMMFVFVCLRDKYITYIEIGAMAVLAGVVYWITDARTDFIVMMMLVIALVMTKLFSKKFKEMMRKKSVIVCCMALPAIVFIITVLLSLNFDYANVSQMNLDAKMSGRLSLGKNALGAYPFKLFGQYVFEHGAGGSTDYSDYYFFIDSSYLSIAIKYGLVFLILVWTDIIHILKKMWNKYCNYMILCVMMVLIQSIMEHHYIQYWYNPYLIFAFSYIGIKKNNSSMLKNDNEILNLN